MFSKKYRIFVNIQPFFYNLTQKNRHNKKTEKRWKKDEKKTKKRREKDEKKTKKDF